jgi:formate dehydrogenase iron-sulfur subunit
MYGLLVDVTKCTGCERCVEACVADNQLDPAAAAHDRAVAPDGLSANRLCALRMLEPGRFARYSCLHCLEPSCVSACLVGGISKSPQGPVVYDPDKCIGCRYCMLACPLHVPRYEWDKTLPLMAKCDMCHDRLQRGLVPACVEACPNQALEFGDRASLLKAAHARIAEQPDRYLPRVWGESEWGGTCVLYISDVDLGACGWPQADTRSIPSLTDPVISKTPIVGLSVGFGLWALASIIERRNRLMSSARTSGETKTFETDRSNEQGSRPREQADE